MTDSAIFQPMTLGGIRLKNRMIRSATHESMADDRGFPTKKLEKLYLRLAKGEVGAIVTGYASIQPDGKSSFKGMLSIETDEHIPAYKNIVDKVHQHNTPIILQLAHCGRQTLSSAIGVPKVAPSAIKDKFFNETTPIELTEEKIEELITNFTAAIVRAQKAGFDAVQLHLAHGYLLSQFLSSYANRRSDRWGGSTENKYRIVSEIFKRAKEAAPDYPVLVKLNAYDGRKNGMRIPEAVKIAKLLEESGCAAIEVSCGVMEDGLHSIRGEKLPIEAAFNFTHKYKNIPRFLRIGATTFTRIFMKSPQPIFNYNLEAAKQIKKVVQVPVIAVGGIHKLADIEDIIENQGIDFVAMSRPFIIEPNIVKKFREHKRSESKCIRCNYCAIIIEEHPLRCHYGKISPKLLQQKVKIS